MNWRTDRVRQPAVALLVLALLGNVSVAPQMASAASSGLAPTVLADSVRDYSGVQGQGGWHYGYYVSPFSSDTFTEMTQFVVNPYGDGRNVWLEDRTQYWTQLWDSGGHPEGAVTSGGRVPVEQWAVRRWVSSVAGTVTFAGTLSKVVGQTGGDGIIGRIFVDGTKVYEQFIAGGDAAGMSYALSATVATGSLVDFAIAPGPSDNVDSTTFSATVTLDAAADPGASQPQTFGVSCACALSPDPVNLATGSFTAHADDLALPGRLLPLAFTRWYNAADTTIGSLGPGWTHAYNWSLRDSGARVEVRRGDGRRDTFTRNADGSYARPPDLFDTLTRSPDGSFTLTLPSQASYDFSASGQLARIREPAGNQIALGYSGANLILITDTAGRAVTLTYDAAGHLTTLSDPLGRRVTYAYDGAGRLARVIDRAGGTWRYAYDGVSQHLTSITDPDGRPRVTNTYDAQGRVVQQRDGLGALTIMSYASGQTTLTDPRGHTTTYTFDSRMRVLSQSDPVGTATYTIAYAYDASGNRTSVTDRNSNRTDFSYDARGNLLTKTDPSPDGSVARPVTTFAYDARNNLTKLTDALGAGTTFAYDGATNVLLSVARQIDPSTMATTRYEYGDPANPGLPTRLTSPRGNTGALPDPTYATTLGYDPQGNLVRRTDPDGALTTFAYDPVGRLTSFVDPDGNAPGAIPADHTWQVSYDALDREVSRTDPLGNTIRTAYDGAGDRTSVTDRNGNVTSYGYDQNARLASVQQRPDPVGTPALVYTTQVARDPNGNAVHVTQANGAATDYAFDALNRLAAVSTHPSATTTLTTSYVLDGNGQPTARTTGDGVSITYQYDFLSRLTGVSGPGLAIGYRYDPVGRRTAMTDPTGTTTYAYDALGRLTALAGPTGTLGYSYDLDGNRTRLGYSATDAVTYAYSPGGRLTTVTDWAARVSTYSYQPSGLVSVVRYPNTMLATYSYDRAQRLAGLTYSLGATIGSERYTLDPEGNRTALSDLIGTTPEVAGSLRYDGLNRLTALERHVVATGFAVANERFALDPASNLASRTGPTATFSYDGANRLTGDGTRMFVWDGADRLTARGADQFGYDPLSRLMSATVAGVARSYGYDGDGLLRSRTEGTSTTPFLYDAAVAPAPLLQAGTERLVYGLGPLYQVHPSGSYDTLVRDGLGSVRLTVSGTGDITGGFDYTAYGAPGAGSFGTALLGYAGELQDPSGLLYLRARWYDPAVGRFISSDSFRGVTAYPVSLNPYAYASAAPSGNTDASGHCAPPLIVVCAIAVRAAVGALVGAGSYTAGILINNVAHIAAGDNRSLWRGFEARDLAISAATGAFSGAIGAPTLGFDRVSQFYLSTLAGYTGSLASVALSERKDPSRDWITVVMGTALSGYGSVVAPEGLVGGVLGLVLSTSSTAYQQALGGSGFGTPQDGLPPAGAPK